MERSPREWGALRRCCGRRRTKIRRRRRRVRTSRTIIRDKEHEEHKWHQEHEDIRDKEDKEQKDDEEQTEHKELRPIVRRIIIIITQRGRMAIQITVTASTVTIPTPKQYHQ